MRVELEELQASFYRIQSCNPAIDLMIASAIDDMQRLGLVAYAEHMKGLMLLMQERDRFSALTVALLTQLIARLEPLH